MSSQFEPLTVAKIKQGGFLEDLEIAFRQAQDRLIEHVARHGLTAKAIIVASLEIKYEATAESKSDKAAQSMPVFGIACDVQVKPPKKPVTYSNSFLAEDQSGRKCLFSPTGGSATGDPKQAILQDSDHNPIGD